MIIAVDTETLGLRPDRGDRPFAVSMTSYDGTDWYWRFEVDPMTREVKGLNADNPQWCQIADMLSHEDWTYVFHNCLFDLAMLRAIGIEVKGRIVDTMLLADCVDNSRLTYGLKPLSETLLGWDNTDESALHKSATKGRREAKKKGWKIAEDVKADFHLADPELCRTYAIQDTQRTMALYKYFEPVWQTPQEGILKNVVSRIALEHALIAPTLKMNTLGMRVHEDKLAELKEYYQNVITQAREKIVALGYPDFNPRSSKQKQEIFYDELALPEVKRRRKGKDGSTTTTRSVDKKALGSWANHDSNAGRLAEVLLELSEGEKQLTAFVEPLQELSVPEEGYKVVRASFNIVGAHASGRMSCSSPNLQQITSATSPGRLSNIEFRLREAFGPRPNHTWVLADYAQIEVVNAAYLSGDRLLIDTIERGDSFHDLTNNALFGQKPDFEEAKSRYRKLSKIINFSCLYGVGPKKLGETLGCDIVEATRIYKEFWNTYSGIKAFSDRLAKQIMTDGYVEDIFGRAYKTPPKGEYKAFNRIIQGTSAQIFKRAFLKASKIENCNVVACVHDEIILEVPNNVDVRWAANQLKCAMQQDFHIRIGKPTPLDIGLAITTTNWSEKQDLEID